MKTELEIIYTLWDIVRAGESNLDDPINERLMRQFLSVHRAKLLATSYKKGEGIPDEVFQPLGVINFHVNEDGYGVSDPIPKIIRFEKGRYGLTLNKGAYTVPVLNSEEFDLSAFNRFDKNKPRVKFQRGVFILDFGFEVIGVQIEDLSDSLMNSAIIKLRAEAAAGEAELTGLAVLVNPSDEATYDWKVSPYPLPDELIENLFNSVMAREFNIFLKMKSDETGNLRNVTTEQDPRTEL